MEVAEAARKPAPEPGGDPITHRILDEAGRKLGEEHSVLCNLINPEALVIGGELGTSGSPSLEGVAAAV